jgi:prepilin-type processing-associated H-X9-DG protein
MSWVPMLLPYLEQDALYKQYDFTKKWNAAPNEVVPGGTIQKNIPGLTCPSAPVPPEARGGANNRGVTDYSPINDVDNPNPNVNPMPAADKTRLGIMGVDVKRRTTDVIDGTSNTMLLAEDAGRENLFQMGMQVNGTTLGSWGNPGNEISISGFNPATKTVPGACPINCTNDNEVYSFHPGVANVLFGDGSVRALSATTDINVLVALMTRAGNEIIPPGTF